MSEGPAAGLEKPGAAAWWSGSGGPRVGASLLVVALVLTIWNVVAGSAEKSALANQNAAVMSLERLLSRARDMETGSRGYALVGSPDYLQPYQDSLATLSADEEGARQDWAASGGDPAALDAAVATLEQRRKLTTEVVETRRTGGLAAVLQSLGTREGKAVMDALRVDIARLQAVAEARARKIERRDRVRSVILTTLAMISAAAAVLGLAWVAWYRRRAAQLSATELVGMTDRFRTLADNIPQLAWMADPQGRIYWYNQRWYDYTGMSPNDMANDGWMRAHDPARVEGVAAGFFEKVQSGEPWQDTFPLRGRDGEYRWFLSLAQPIRNARGEVTRWFGTNTDVTLQRQQEEELAAARDAAEEANRAKSQFLANMSHELRTPLSAVIGYSEMLEEEVEELGQTHLVEDLEKIKSNARHLLSLINDVLDLSKIEANKMELYAESFAIPAMIREVAATVGSLVERKQNRLVVEAPDDLGTMHTDVVKIRQILINLLSNAAKFTENGQITLSAERRSGGREGDTIVFAVRDTGLGMTEEQVAKLFQRFTQADASTTRRFGGTGLGLAITKAFSAMLGGSVGVASVAGEGSTFTVEVPATLPSTVAEEGDAVVEVSASESDVILVIDDDPATRDLLTRFLTREGFTVRVAADGRSGLALAEALKPRAILLDVTMPRMDGWEVLRSLKHDPRLAAIPVIMCTIIDEQNLGFSLGASDYLIKPVDWDRLKEVLERVAKEAPQGDVLVIDDDADTRERLQALLSREGWTVTEAENGRAGLEAARRHAPTLVLLDLTMPEMDGFTFLRTFRATPGWSGIPVVVMTARDLSADERAELKGGDARVVQKGSVSLQDLVGQLRALKDAAPAARPRQPESALA